MAINFFKSKSSGPVIKDLVWNNNIAKQQGCSQLLKQYPDAIIAGWFSDTINRFRQSLITEYPGIVVRDIRHLASPHVENKLVILLEHYPLYRKEEQLWQNWKAAMVYVLNSLDEPLFSYFGGDNLAALLQKMGMGETESIEHPLVSKAIRNAQQKLEMGTSMEHHTGSQEEWFRRNIPVKQ